MFCRLTWGPQLTRKRIAWFGAVILGAAGFAVYLAIGSFLVAAKHHAVAPPPPGLPIEALSLPSRSGATLAAWLITPEDPRATAIVLHGMHSDRGTMLGRAKFLRQLGFVVLLPDLQAHGESTGERVTLGHLEALDAVSSAEYLKWRYPDLPMGAIGVSLGGAALSYARADLPLKAAVLEAVYPTVAEAVENRVAMRAGPLAPVLAPLLMLQLKPRLGVGPDELRPVDAIREVPYPVLIVSGATDEHTTASQTQALFAAARQPKELWLVDGAAHVDLLRYDPPGYRSRVSAFLERYVLGQS